ncbi:PREDICTED: protein COFACTOR ASSEMBLY OF COMPLEX C SUBUNIT B CCB1, chloroplastic [Nicotiana attenuata]|uniref:Protein cofactor assembly of complex c subunit b ccb1, chloroplastic n=1 Tax=Nicotiana attenuata TaxID=49451 RepID=A0A1J6I8D0_NICAT|nr:PREDICTED: protein COFACTOR ASSEMBLY OF COMPLEX C SUBUNIT B CCB1, chloroplastic [Nicotiana attenuata]OIS96799.1 protein cofactor assembly of complex c subunit b ccb1, chloroplastic [Nicotiana attenuata]
MAAKLLLSPLSLPSSFLSTREFQHHHRHLCLRTKPRTRFTVHAFTDALFTAATTSAPVLVLDQFQENPSSLFSVAAADAGYSVASYYTSLGLFVISVPGLWSLIKRSVKSKIVQKTFVKEGIEEGKKAANQVAGEILSFFTRNNFSVLDRGETITFEGMMVPSRGQAALLTFCTCISLGSVALVLTITVPDVGNNWFWITALSPLAGVYYWTRASRKEQIKVKMTVGDDGSLSEIVVQGDDQEVEKMRKELQLSEKGMVYVKGLLER